ncbi:hypothetical protein Golax_025796, partial [Gossypium laxum]|nr:hypothetical protein [Gossypium laxum]
MDSDVPKKVSFRDMVLNASLETEFKKESWVEDDIELIEEDVKKEIVDGVPSIDFSERLMDVKNDYFLAKFETMEDYTNILSKGLWVIFGHYLTVQPRFPSFIMLQSYPHKVVVTPPTRIRHQNR